MVYWNGTHLLTHRIFLPWKNRKDIMRKTYKIAVNITGKEKIYKVTFDNRDYSEYFDNKDKHEKEK